MDVNARAKRNHSLVLRRLGEHGRQVAIATAMGVSETTISRLKTEHLESLCELLAHAGLKIVPVEMKTFPATKIDALLTLAKEHLASIESADDMSWEEDGRA